MVGHSRRVRFFDPTMAVFEVLHCPFTQITESPGLSFDDLASVQ